MIFGKNGHGGHKIGTSLGISFLEIYSCIVRQAEYPLNLVVENKEFILWVFRDCCA
jgi:hypothetical protein